MKDDAASKTYLAHVLGLTTRQVTNLVEEGLPREVKGNRVTFDLPAAVQWYVRYKEGKAAPLEDEKRTLMTRKLELEVKLQEIEVAKAQAGVVTLEYMEQQLSAVLQRLRAALLSAPGKFAPALVGLKSIAEALTRLDGIMTELISALAETADDPELDPEDAPDGEGDLAP